MAIELLRLPFDYPTLRDAWRRIGNGLNGLMTFVAEDQERQDKALEDHNTDPGAHPGLGAEVLTYGELIPGTGNVWDDLNAHDFTGHAYAVGDSLEIKTNAFVTFGHNGVSYQWTGPRGVLVGGTQAGRHIAVSGDLSPLGTGRHDLLSNRNEPSQHETSAITGLDAHQATQDAGIQQNTTNLANHVADTSNPHQVTHDQLVGQAPEPDPHPQYQKKLPGMVLGGTADSFTLNTTDSKVQNYSLAGQWNWEDQLDVDPVNGNITIPQDGVYEFVANIIGNQGNDTKEEWIELRLDTTGGGAQPPARDTVSVLDVTTDKTDYRQLITTATRAYYAGEVLSLWMWASAGLGTFTVLGVTFEFKQKAEVSDLVTP